MRKLFSLIIFFSLTLNLTFAQSPNVSWVTKSTNMGGLGGSKKITTDGQNGVYAIGDFASPVSFGGVSLSSTSWNSNQTFYLVKFDTLGNAIWGRTHTGYFNYSHAKSVSTDKLGNIYVAGYFNGDSVIFGNYTLKKPFSSGIYDNIFIVKYNSAGTVLWAKCAKTYNNYNGTCSAEGISADSLGNSYVIGSFSSKNLIVNSDTVFNSSGPSPIYSDIFVLKLDPQGNTIWMKSFGGNNEDSGNAIATKGSNVYITGNFGSTSMQFQGDTIFNYPNGLLQLNSFLTKLDTSGTVKWAKSVQAAANTNAVSVAAGNNGKSYITGTFNSPEIIFGTDTINQNNSFSFFTAYDSLGTVEWAKGATNGYDVKSTQITTEPSGNVYITGYYRSSSMQFDSLVLYNNYGGYEDIFVVKYNPTGKAIWAKSFGGNNLDIGTGISVSKGSVYINGHYASPSIIFGSYSVTASSGGFQPHDLFVTKISGSCTAATILTQSTNQNKHDGQTASFSVTATGSPIISYQWYMNGYPINNATSNLYTTAILSTSDNLKTYYCRVSNCDYSYNTFSITDTLNVCSKAVIFDQNLTESAQTGDSVKFYINLYGVAPYFFQWYKNNVPIPGANNNFYYTPPLTISDSGNVYYCEVINCWGMDTTRSADATLSTYVGINELENLYNHEVVVYPNPTNDVFYIKCPIAIQQVKFSNVFGQITKVVDHPKSNVAFSPEQAGVYYIEIITNAGTLKRKIIKVN